MDRGQALHGLMQDLDSLGARLGRLFDRAHVLRFMDRPSRVGRGDVHAWSSFAFPPRGTPILVVTALTAKNTPVWLAFAERCKRLDHPLTLIVPQLAGRAAGALARLARLASWDQRTNVRALRRPARREATPSSEHGALLARYAARSAFIDPHLLRELRRGLIPDATAEAELQVWNMRGATAKTAKGFVFDSKRLEELRAEPVPRLLEAFEIIAKAHENASELLQLEDLLVRTSLVGDSVDDIFEKVLHTMEQQPHRAKNLASWFARASGRFPRSAHHGENAKILSVVASAHVPHVQLVGAPQSEAALARTRRLVPQTEESLWIAVRVRMAAPPETESTSTAQILPRPTLSHPVVELRHTRPGSANPGWHVLHVVKTHPVTVAIDGTNVTLDPASVTTATARALPIKIADLGGHEWLIESRSTLQSVATIRNGEKELSAYLISKDLCVSAVYGLDTELPVLEFPWGSVQGRVIGRGGPAIHWSLIRLERPVTPSPLPIGEELQLADSWEIILGPAKRLRGTGALPLRNDIGQRLPLPHPLDDPRWNDRHRGAPVLREGRVVGHVMHEGPHEDGPSIFMLPIAEVAKGCAEVGAFGDSQVEDRILHEGLAPLNITSNDRPRLGLVVGRRSALVTDPKAWRQGEVAASAGRKSWRLSSRDGSSSSGDLEFRLMSMMPLEPVSTDGRPAHPRVASWTAPSSEPTLVGFTVAGGAGRLGPVSVREVVGRPAVLPNQARPGSTFLRDGCVTGVVGRAFTLLKAEDLVDTLSKEYLAATDWARLDRLRTRRAEASEPSSADGDLQFRFEQSVRRFEQQVRQRTEDPEEPRLWAELATDERGHPVREPAGYAVRLRVTPPGAVLHVDYRGFEALMREEDPRQGLPCILIASQDLEVAASLDLGSRGQQVLTDRLSSLLDATLVAEEARAYSAAYEFPPLPFIHGGLEAYQDAIDDLEAYQDAIDDLRDGRLPAFETPHKE